MQIDIVGGSSDYNKITVVSTEFESTAFSNKNGQITCNVKRHSFLKRFAYKNRRNVLIPRLVTLFLILTADLKKKDWAIIGFCLLCLFSIEKFFSGQNYPADLLGKTSLFITLHFKIIIVFCFVAVFLFSMIRRNPSAKWHGAEHMVISAYQHTGSSDIECIAAESPMNDKCGTMLYLPLIIGIIAANFIIKIFNINEIIAYLITFEGVITITALNGWNKVRGITRASYFLQKNKNVDTPGMQELLTAQRALQELIFAHDSLLIEKIEKRQDN